MLDFVWSILKSCVLKVIYFNQLVGQDPSKCRHVNMDIVDVCTIKKCMMSHVEHNTAKMDSSSVSDSTNESGSADSLNVMMTIYPLFGLWVVSSINEPLAQEKQAQIELN